MGDHLDEEELADVVDAVRDATGETMSSDAAAAFLEWLQVEITKSVDHVVTALDGDALSGKEALRVYEAARKWLMRRAREWREEGSPAVKGGTPA